MRRRDLLTYGAGLATLAAVGGAELSQAPSAGAAAPYLAPLPYGTALGFTHLASDGTIYTLPALTEYPIPNGQTQKISRYKNGAWSYLEELVGGAIIAADAAGNIYMNNSINTGLQRWNASTQTWSTLAAPPIRTYSGALVVDRTNGYVYLINGIRPGGTRSAALQRYNISTNTWTLLADSLSSMSYQAAVLVAGNLYMFASLQGVTSPNSSVVVPGLARGLKYTPSTNAWAAVYVDPDAITLSITVAPGNTIYVEHNKLNAAGNSYDPIIRKYITTTGKWTDVVVPDRNYGHLIYTNSHLYNFGGTKDFGLTVQKDSVEIL